MYAGKEAGWLENNTKKIDVCIGGMEFDVGSIQRLGVKISTRNQAQNLQKPTLAVKTRLAFLKSLVGWSAGVLVDIHEKPQRHGFEETFLKSEAAPTF